LDHNSGRQISFVHLEGGREDAVATVNRDATWQFIDAPRAAPDRSMAIAFIDVGAKPAALLIPLTSGLPTFHTGLFAGFVDANASAALTTGRFVAPAVTMPSAGAAYALPTVDDLIATELALNPGRTVVAKASRDAVDGDATVRTFEVARDRPGPVEAYLDCFGPSSVTVTSGSQSVTSPCLRAGAYVLATEATGPIVVTASSDTSWRVIVYAP
jgi:hypothetical protein